MLFEDRREAGIQLSQKLLQYRDKKNTVVLALPRGGVPVAFEISQKLNCPLDVLVVRKLGAPNNREFGIGAIASDTVKVLDDRTIEALGITYKDLADIEKEEKKELRRRESLYRHGRPKLKLERKTVILVDDGLATGLSSRAAVLSILSQNPKKLIVAMPVCAQDAIDGLNSILRPQDEVLCLATPYDFSAVGIWYKNFSEVSDEQVCSLLERAQYFSHIKKNERSFRGS